jgi:anaerobic selenocysteine-containing dehydrogenase
LQNSDCIPIEGSNVTECHPVGFQWVMEVKVRGALHLRDGDGQLAGDCRGYFLMGENPAIGSANAKMQRRGMANLEWLVVRDFSLIESATGPGDARLYGRDPQDGVGGDGTFFLLLDEPESTGCRPTRW